MLVRIALVVVVLVVAALALWHRAPQPFTQVRPSADASASADAGAPAGATAAARRHRHHREGSADGLVVYVAGAVKRPGLYTLSFGDRYARAIAMAGGLQTGADAAGVDLAQRAQDGEEIFVPLIGETSRVHARTHRSRRHAASPPPEGSVDVNAAGAAELAAVPGIGRALAARIVELRRREGNFASLDELLDVAGMTQSRLERARSYLREP